MALLEEINYSPGEDSMQEVFDKINIAIQNINAVLGGGTAEQGIKKSDSTDFNFEFYDVPEINGAFSSITLTGDAVNGNGLGYRKDAAGNVQLKGLFLVPYNTTSSVFTLPVGFRPLRTSRYLVGISPSKSLAAWIDINTSGVASIISPSGITSGNISFNLEGITFYN